MQENIKQKLDAMVRQRKLHPVEPSGFTKSSPGAGQRKINGDLRFCADYQIHIYAEVLDEDIERIFHNFHGAQFFVIMDLPDAYYQIELEEESKDICTINTSQGLYLMFGLPQGLNNTSNIFKNVLVHTATREQFGKRKLAVKSRLTRTQVTINEAVLNLKLLKIIRFLG